MTQTYKVQVSMNQAHIVESGFVWKQGDFGFNIEIEVLDFDTTGATPQIIFRKSTGAVEATEITRAGNKFTYAIRGTELDTPGPCVCDLKLNDSTTKRVSTASFKYFVIPDTMDGLEQEASSYSDTIEQIIAGYEDDVETINSNIAPAYSSSATYNVGDYVIYDNTLYKCKTVIATAETWTASHWTQAVVSDDTANLKSAFINNDISKTAQFYDGYVNTSGVITSNTSHKYSELIPVETGERYHVIGNESTSAMLIAMYADASGNADTSKSITGTNSLLDTVVQIPSEIKYIRIGVRNSAGKPSVYKMTTLEGYATKESVDKMFVHGKNRLELEYSRTGQNGIDIYVKNGQLEINGTVTTTENINIPIDDVVAGVHTLSITRKNTGNLGGVSIVDLKRSGSVANTFIDLGAFTNADTSKNANGNITNGKGLYLRLRVDNGAVFSDFKALIQLESGSTVTDYEQPTVEFLNNTSYARRNEKKPLRVCLVGDIHVSINVRTPSGYTWLERMQLLADAVNKEHNKKPFDFLLCTGDLVYHPSANDSEAWWKNRVAYMFNMPVYIMAGNHEYAFTDERFREMTGNPRQFSIEKDNWYFVCLDTFKESVEYTGIDTEFLAAEMAKANGKDVIVCGHYFDSDIVLEGLKEQYNNIVLFDAAHTHAWSEHQLSDGTWRLNNGSFTDPKKSWDTVGEESNPTTNLWGFRVLETDGNVLKTYQIQPAHNYTGIEVDLPYSVNDIISIGEFNLSPTASYVIGKNINNKKYSDRFIYIENS